jgi:hypothetical protein
MSEFSSCLDMIYDALRDVNLDRPADQHLALAPDTVLGLGGMLDSLTLITILAAVDQDFEARFGRPLNLLADPALLDDNGPLVNIKSLAAFICTKLPAAVGS